MAQRLKRKPFLRKVAKTAIKTRVKAIADTALAGAYLNRRRIDIRIAKVKRNFGDSFNAGRQAFRDNMNKQK